MGILQRLRSRFGSFLFRRKPEEDFEAELAAHVELSIGENMARGMSLEEARRKALISLGGVTQTRELHRNTRGLPALDSLLQDGRYALRGFRRNPALAAAVVLSLSLTIGACTAAFSLIDALILRPLPVSQPERLISLAYRAPGDTPDATSFNYPLFEQLREAGQAHVQLFGMSDQDRQNAWFDDAGGQPEKVYGQWISGDALSILGVRPALGRLLTASDDLTPGQHPVAVLSYDFWQRRFSGNPAALGRWLTVRGKQLQIVGVAERGFSGVEPGIMTDFWAPNMMWDDRAITDSSMRWFRIWGRLQPGGNAMEARTVLQRVSTNFRREQAKTRQAETSARREAFVNAPLHLRAAANGPSALREYFERPLWTLGAIALLVLLIAGANVAALLTARAAARDRDMALRISIGAGRWRLIQQVFVESGLLSIGSCVLGALLAKAAAPEIVSMLSTSRSVVRLDLHLDWRVLVFLMAAGVAVTFLFGLAPAIRASGVSPNDVLKAGGGKLTGKTGLFRPLATAQTAFSFVVLFVAGLCLASFAKLAQTDPGFDPDQLAIVRVEDDEGKAGSAAWMQLVQDIGRSPGIQSASLSAWGLFEGGGRNKSIRIAGQPVDPDDPWYLPVSPGFLETMRIRLLDGRDLQWTDLRAERSTAVIVNETFARRYFPGQSAFGRRFHRVDGGSTLTAQEIVGIAADAKYTSLRGATPATVYDVFAPEGGGVVQLRTAMDPSGIASLLRHVLPRNHPAFRVTDVTLQSTLVNNTIVRDRALALLAGFFAAVALVLAAVGLFAVLSYSVVQRTREFGIRLALGARPGRIAALVASEIGIVVGAGLLLGIPGGFAASRLLSKILYEIRPSDPWSIAAPLLCLGVTCLISGLLPTWRAARIEPTTALRYE